MEEPIRIEVEFDGADAAATGASKVKQSLSDLAAQQTAAATKAIAFSQRLQAAAGAVNGLSAALGIDGRAAGLISSMAATTSQFAQLGQVLGPQGALVGGIVGSLLPAIGAIRQAIEELDERNRESAERLDEVREAHEQAVIAIREATQAIDEQADAVVNASEQMRDFIDSMSLGGLRGQAFDAAAQISALSDQLADVNDQIGNLGGATGADAAMRLLDLRERAQQLTGEIGRLSDSFEQTQAQVRESTASRRRSGNDTAAVVDGLAGQLNDLQVPSISEAMGPDVRAAIEHIRALREAADAAFQSINERSSDFDSQVGTAATAIAEVETATRALADTERELFAQREEASRRHIAQLEQEKAKVQENDAEERRAVIRRMEQTAEYEDQLMEANRRTEEAYRARVEEYQQVTSVLVGGLTDALAAIVAGQKTAEEAFKGLLASFLKFISEQSMLKAASEFAFAIADFASQNYGGGAQHLAAGVAFTAVAVAAGAGAAAVSAPSAGAKDGPEEGRSSRDEAKGGDIVINYNSPVISLGDRAQMGRELRGLVADADARYG